MTTTLERIEQETRKEYLATCSETKAALSAWCDNPTLETRAVWHDARLRCIAATRIWEAALKASAKEVAARYAEDMKCMKCGTPLNAQQSCPIRGHDWEANTMYSDYAQFTQGEVAS